jgi:hypothetical protein
VFKLIFPHSNLQKYSCCFYIRLNISSAAFFLFLHHILLHSPFSVLLFDSYTILFRYFAAFLCSNVTHVLYFYCGCCCCCCGCFSHCSRFVCTAAAKHKNEKCNRLPHKFNYYIVFSNILYLNILYGALVYYYVYLYLYRCSMVWHNIKWLLAKKL